MVDILTICDSNLLMAASVGVVLANLAASLVSLTHLRLAGSFENGIVSGLGADEIYKHLLYHPYMIPLNKCPKVN